MRRNFVYFSALLSFCLPINELKVIAQETSEKKPTIQLTQTLPKLDRSTEVAVGMYLIDFDDFNEQEESFTLDGYLFLNWRDERLAFNPSQTGGKHKTYNSGQIWTPNVSFLNIEGKREAAYKELKVKPDGTVYYKEKFTGQFNYELDLKEFPFDSQKIQIILTTLDDSKNIIFTVDKTKTGKSQDAFLAGWTIGEEQANVRTIKSDIEEAYFPEFVYEIDVFRYSKPYIWNIILPLLFIIGLSWTVFWSRSFESNTVIATSSLLSAIAFNIVVAEELPKVAYLTFINGFILIVYIFICLVVIYTVVKHRLDLEKQKERSLKIDRVARWLVPVMFAASNIGLLAFFLL